jgi:putative addiction module component (TIGR02574 family)
MSEQAQQVLRDALDLPPIERAELIEELYRSFDFPSRELADSLWAAESEKRIDAYEQGKVGATPANQVFDRIGSRKSG